MPTLVVLATCKIQLYAGDHAPPHFKITDQDRMPTSPSRPSNSSPVASRAGRSAKPSPGHRARKTAHASAANGSASTSAADRPVLPRLRSVEPLAPFRLRVVWKDGRRAEVDLAPQILRYRLYRPLRRDPAAFARARLVDGGVAVAWGPGLDIAADSIAALERAQSLTAEQFRRRLARLGLSFDAAAAAFDLSRRQIAYYAAGGKPIPRHVVLAVRGFEAEMGEGVGSPGTELEFAL